MSPHAWVAEEATAGPGDARIALRHRPPEAVLNQVGRRTTISRVSKVTQVEGGADMNKLVEQRSREVKYNAELLLRRTGPVGIEISAPNATTPRNLYSTTRAGRDSEVAG